MEELKRELELNKKCVNDLKINNSELEKWREIASKEISSLSNKINKYNKSQTSFSITNPEEISDQKRENGFIIFEENAELEIAKR